MALKKVLVNNKLVTFTAKKIDKKTLEVEHAEQVQRITLVSYDSVTGKVVVQANGQNYILYFAASVQDQKTVLFAGSGNKYVVEKARSTQKEQSVFGARSTSMNMAELTSPVTGKVIRVLATQGQRVVKNQPLVVIESMKMENEICAQADGFIKTILIDEGNVVRSGQRLVVFDCNREGSGDAKHKIIKETSQSG